MFSFILQKKKYPPFRIGVGTWFFKYLCHVAIDFLLIVQELHFKCVTNCSHALDIEASTWQERSFRCEHSFAQGLTWTSFIARILLEKDSQWWFPNTSFLKMHKHSGSEHWRLKSEFLTSFFYFIFFLILNNVQMLLVCITITKCVWFKVVNLSNNSWLYSY